MFSQSYLFSLFAIVIFISACTEKTSKTDRETKIEKSGITAKVTSSAGENLKQTALLDIPTFFNVAKVSGTASHLETIVLGPKQSKGQLVDIHPLATFRFRMDSLQVKYLVSVPSNYENDALGDNYLTFMSLNNELCLAVENWFKAQCGLVKCSSFKWDNPQKTLLQLN